MRKVGDNEGGWENTVRLCALSLPTDALANPHEPGRPKANITDLARLGQTLLQLIAQAVDNQVGLKMAVEVSRC
jgi:hypothetical protein